MLRLEVGLIALLVTAVAACGGTAQSRSQSDEPDDTHAGSGAEVSDVGGSAGATAVIAPGGIGGNGGFASSGGIGGGAGQAGAGGLGGGNCSPSLPLAAASCDAQCDAPMVACLLTAAHALPAANVTVSAQVVSVAKVPAGEQPSCPFGSVGGDATRITLRDAEGTSWELLFPEQAVAIGRFPVTSELEVAYETSAFNGLAREHLLTISEREELAFFMIHGSRAAAVPTLDLGWTYSGACAAAGYCSLVQSQMRAELGGEQVTDPCRAKLGEFSVSSSYLSATGNAPLNCGSTNICDMASQFRALGVRSP